MSEFFKWLIVGWSVVVVGIAALGTILIVKFGEVKRIGTDDITLCYITAFFAGSSLSSPFPFYPEPSDFKYSPA